MRQTNFTAALRGKVVVADGVARSLTLMVDSLQSWPGGMRVTDVKRSVELSVLPSVDLKPARALIASAKLAAAQEGTACGGLDGHRAGDDRVRAGSSTLTTERLVVG